MKIFRIIKCMFYGHDLEDDSIVKTMNPNNWLRKCKRCGLYVMHSDIGQITVNEKEAYEIKEEFEDCMKIFDHKKSQIYISGAITDNPNYKEEFAKAEEFLSDGKGWEVINPAKNVCSSYKEYIDVGLMQLMECDAIYMLDNGWELSKGASLELEYAKAVGLRIIYENYKEGVTK